MPTSGESRGNAGETREYLSYNQLGHHGPHRRASREENVNINSTRVGFLHKLVISRNGMRQRKSERFDLGTQTSDG